MTTNYSNAPTRSVDVGGTPFVYREIGTPGGVPIVFLHHFTAVLEDWDPRVIDGLARNHHVVIFDNRGVGGSGGETPTSVQEMARDAVAFIGALGHKTVDLVGFSLGGFIAQVIAVDNPGLVRKLILAGTGPAGADLADAGTPNPPLDLEGVIAKAQAAGKHPKHLLFFTQTAAGQKEANAFLARLDEREEDRDHAVVPETIHAQTEAIGKWNREAPVGLTELNIPTLIVNGDRDVMVPTARSLELLRLIPDSRLSIYPDAGHGGLFQFHALFVEQAHGFLTEPA
ncbi:alpha/beta fold hydrolase [Agrobacterium deltaense]|uniref:alpha/beta fold hydrolase n=1 Tax=Agrobacterium deltaense TaxID=1183412 RepID=UPI003FCF15C0